MPNSLRATVQQARHVEEGSQGSLRKNTACLKFSPTEKFLNIPGHYHQQPAADN